MSRLDRQRRLFLRAAVLPPAEARAAWQAWLRGGDLMRMDSESDRMVCVLHGNLERAGVRSAWSGVLQGNYRYHWTKNRIAVGAVEDALAALQAAGLRVCLGRELAFLCAYGGGLGARVMGRIALRIGNLSGAAAVLARTGWAVESGGPEHRDVVRNDGHRLTLQSTVYPGRPVPETGGIWSRVADTRVGESVAARLDPADELLALAAHAHTVPSDTMRLLADAYLLLPHCDAGRLIEDARRWRYAGALTRLLQALEDELDLALPPFDEFRRVRPTWFERVEARCLTSPGLRRLSSCFSEVRSRRLRGPAAFAGFVQAALSRIEKRLRSVPGAAGARRSTARRV